LRELVKDPAVLEELLSTPIGYPQSNGPLELRQKVAALYPGASEENVLITPGCSQANFIATITLLKPGDEIAVMLPNYMQVWGIAQNYGFPSTSFYLKEELGWSIDPDELKRAVSDRTRAISVVNPNNPTGHILTPAEMDAIIAAAGGVGAWLLCDEVYIGSERLTSEETPSFWGRYDRVVITSSLSKTCALPGLRLGWIIAPAGMIREMWARQDYVAISTSLLSNKLALYALSPEVYPRLLERTRAYIRGGYESLERWFLEHSDRFSLIPPQATATAFLRYHLPVNSTELVGQLIQESTFVLPGDLFGIDHFLRIGFGLPEDYLNEGLKRLNKVISKLT
jgi:aspartate/methionine/tyrosine aminotransferase